MISPLFTPDNHVFYPVGQSLIISECINSYYDKRHLAMVACPLFYADNHTLLAFCANAEPKILDQFVPVVHNGVMYQNHYCAACYGVQSLEESMFAPTIVTMQHPRARAEFVNETSYEMQSSLK
jgi:hypothetical protein